jgi:putative transposase
MIDGFTEKEMKYGIRNSKMFLNEVYFWTDTINHWKVLLQSESYKNVIIDCWRELAKRKKIVIYGFVIMPNHLHILWEMMEMNGKEMPYASFNKFSSHRFLEILRIENPTALLGYKKNDQERKHRFWQRDPLAVCMDSKEKFEQKLDYIHFNPLQDHWNLANRPEEYKYSSARFYDSGIDEFNIVTDYRERF